MVKSILQRKNVNQIYFQTDLARVASVSVKIIFRGCQIIHSLSNGAMLERLVNATL